MIKEKRGKKKKKKNKTTKPKPTKKNPPLTARARKEVICEQRYPKPGGMMSGVRPHHIGLVTILFFNNSVR